MGMGFEVVYSPQPPLWVPVNTTGVMMMGGLVSYGLRIPADSGVQILTAASGTADRATARIPYGVVIGDNNRTPVYTTLATAAVKVRTITGCDTASAQLARTDWVGVEGSMYPKNDPQPMVQIVRITSDTILKGYFRNSATVGTTVIPEIAASSGLSTTGATFAATLGFTSVAYSSTLCYTSGANAGIYRMRSDAGTSITTNAKAFPATPVAGDKAKSVPVRQGICQLQTDTTYGLWIDTATTTGTNYWSVNVLDMNLNTDPGNEYCIFSFTADQFLTATGGRSTT